MNPLKPLAITAVSIAMLVLAQAGEETPLPSIRGMFCNSPCSGIAAPDRHMGELATLVIFRQQCFKGPPRYVGDVEGQPPQVLDYRFEPVWQEWNSASMEQPSTRVS
jgi:hypothetical protein